MRFLTSVAGDDQREMLESENLLMDLRRCLTERTLDAEMDYHLASSYDPNSRNGHNHKTVLTAIRVRGANTMPPSSSSRVMSNISCKLRFGWFR